ncbi:MAG: hypothetical protein IPP47_07630 [Bryobacterales bacterium]|nr:hypothetical protein [Bryobacterales bacterium]
MSKIKRVLLWFGGLLVAAGVIAGVGMAFFGLRFDRDGTGMRPLPYVDRTEQRLQEIEKRAAAEHQPAEAAAAEPAAVVADQSAPWPLFNGAKQDGVYRDSPIQVNWPAKGLPEVWRKPVGGGYASMIVAQGGSSQSSSGGIRRWRPPTI